MAVETFEGQTKTISASKLMGRDVTGPSLGKVSGGTSATGKLAGIVKGNKQAIAINAEKITRLKKISELQSKKISGDDIGSKLPTEETAILDSLDNILEALRKEQKAKDKLDADDRKRKENKKRKMKESGLEKSLKVIKKQGEKMIAPVTNMFDKLKEGLLMLVAGRVVIKLFEWFQDDKNREKIDTVFRFLSDWWPAIIGGILLFAPMLFGPAGFIVMIGALVIGFLPKLISATKQLFGFGQQTEKDADAANKDLSDVKVINHGEMINRRINWKINLIYSTSVEQLESIRNQIKEYIIDSNDFASDGDLDPVVRVVELGGSSIDMMIVAYADPMGFAAFNEVKENLIYSQGGLQIAPFCI